MKTYIAQRQIDHDNQVYQAEESLDLDDKTAKPLLDIGAVVEKPAETSGESSEDDGDANPKTGKKTAKKAE